MSIYSSVESGTSWHRSRFHRSISFSKRFDCRFAELVPVLAKFCLPGDVWRIGGNALVRFHPMLSPTLTQNYLKVRYFFVPLRLVEPNTELIITGSDNGKLSEETIPTFDDFMANLDSSQGADYTQVKKYSFWDYMGVQLGDYAALSGSAFLPALYWFKGFLRCWFDYYRDENIDSNDFDTIVQNNTQTLWTALPNVRLPKDYFTSSLPWQLKAPGGIAPAIDVTGTASIGSNFNFLDGGTSVLDNTIGVWSSGGTTNVGLNTSDIDKINAANEAIRSNFTNMTINGLGFTVDDLRTITAQTRIFERLARTGSRYTEYLYANFGTSPRDDTLQRPQYLGGWKIPIVTTEVLQTAEDGANPVGTMRGHGITNGGNRIQTFHCKEFGLLFGLAHIMPKIEYTTGISKELSYKSRFDFFNPSFQHLSEQEVRNGELYVNFTPDAQGNYDNDDTFGFQAYANELRTSVDMTVAGLRDSLGYWNQALKFNSRPNLNTAFLNAGSHRGSFNRPFVVSGEDARPVIVDFYNDLDVYRPMVRYSTPGLVDHL